MLEAILQLGVGFVIALSGALIPGPLLAFVVVKTLESGPTAGTFAAMGHILVELGVLSLLAFGLSALLKNQILMRLIGGVGGALLLVLGGFVLFQSRGSGSLQSSPVGIDRNPVVGGILFSTIFNPSVFLWWATVGLATLMGAIGVAGLTGGIFWIIGHFLADLSWFSAVSYSVNKGKKLIGGSFYRVLLIACGFTLLVFGIYFLSKYLLTFI